MDEIQPDLLILSGGYAPKMVPFFEQTWDEFSGAWNNDTKIAYGFMAAALKQPMQPGSMIVSFSSGAALEGSYLSGGYAGAKRMQHFIANYAQRAADQSGLDLTFCTVIPKQLMPETDLGGDLVLGEERIVLVQLISERKENNDQGRLIGSHRIV